MKTYEIGHFNRKGDIVALETIQASTLTEAKTLYLKRYTKQKRANLVGRVVGDIAELGTLPAREAAKRKPAETVEPKAQETVKAEPTAEPTAKQSKKEQRKADKVAKVKASAKPLVKAVTPEQAKAEQSDLEVTVNLTTEYKKPGIEIYFSAYPGSKIIKKLKDAKFRWYNAKKCWIAYQNAATMEVAEYMALIG